MALNDYTDDELLQELERRQYEKDDAVLAVEKPNDASLYVRRSNDVIEIDSGTTTYRIFGSQLRCLQVMVNFARHYGKKQKFLGRL